jgi:hypothetical protein
MQSERKREAPEDGLDQAQHDDGPAASRSASRRLWDAPTVQPSDRADQTHRHVQRLIQSELSPSRRAVTLGYHCLRREQIFLLVISDAWMLLNLVRAIYLFLYG